MMSGFGTLPRGCQSPAASGNGVTITVHHHPAARQEMTHLRHPHACLTSNPSPIAGALKREEAGVAVPLKIGELLR